MRTGERERRRMALVAATSSPLLPGWIGCRARGADDVPVGVVADVLFDARSRAPSWLLLDLDDGRHVVAPACGLCHRHDGVQLACSGDLARSAPVSAVPPDGLGREHALALAAHYGVRCGAGPWSGILQPTVARAPAPSLSPAA